MTSSFFDIRRTFLTSFAVRDIADPLLSFDADALPDRIRDTLRSRNVSVAGIRENGTVSGYVTLADLETDPKLSVRPVEPLIDQNASLADVIGLLVREPIVFVSVFGSVNGIVTRDDLQDPPVRMWLFGLVTLMEMQFAALIRRRFPDDSWRDLLSSARLAKAEQLLEERLRRCQTPELFDCLQFSDKTTIIMHDEILCQQVGVQSRRRAHEFRKNMESLRNSLAHSQDIVSTDWDAIVTLSGELDRIVRKLEEFGSQ